MSSDSRYQIQFRTEITSGGKVVGMTNWRPYPEVDHTAHPEELEASYHLLREVYRQVRVAMYETVERVILGGE